MKLFVKRVLSFIARNKQGNILILCLFFSFILWFLITYSRSYRHNETYEIRFVDNSNKVEFATKDSVINVDLQVSGFNFLTNQVLSKNKKKVVIDLDDLDINLSKGHAVLSTARLKPLIMKCLGYDGVEAKISPASINLSWNKVYNKKVTVVNRAKFIYKKPYGQYQDPELLFKEVLIEGNIADLQAIDTIYTEEVTYKNIDRNAVFMVPLDLGNIPANIYCQTTSIPIRVVAEKFTENTVNVPVNVVRYEDNKSVKIFPKTVRVRYRIATKDYNKVNDKDFNAYVTCSNDEVQTSNSLKVELANVPDFVKIVSIIPQKVDYILYN